MKPCNTHHNTHNKQVATDVTPGNPMVQYSLRRRAINVGVMFSNISSRPFCNMTISLRREKSAKIINIFNVKLNSW